MAKTDFLQIRIDPKLKADAQGCDILLQVTMVQNLKNRIAKELSGERERYVIFFVSTELPDMVRFPESAS